jgi:NAD(P)-dependent dehydrogenase (short-subunit alcohol dehydrogenase family)
MANYHIIVGGGSGIGLHLSKYLLTLTSDNIIIFDNQFTSNSSIFDKNRTTQVQLDINSNTAWGSFFPNVERISSISFIIPSCKSRDSTANEMGYTNNFINNVANINFSFIKLIDTTKSLLTINSSIIFISSILNDKIAIGDATLDYHASKAVIGSITRYMALKLAPNTTVNAIAPGLISRNSTSALITDKDLAYTVKRSVPLLRPCSQDEVAQATFSLINGRFPYLTGQTIIMDGGSSIVDIFSAMKD